MAIPFAVLGALAASVGADRLFWQNLWPIDFLRVAGFNAYREWTPFDAASVASSLARGAIYLSLLAGLTATAVKLHGARGLDRAKALWPLGAACLGSLFLLLAWKASGVFSGAEAAVQEEAKQLLLGISWLPLLSLLAAVLIARALLRRQSAPLSGRWPLDLALAAAAVLLCSRAYDQFTMTSAAPYYAAPAVLLLGLLHQRLGDRWPVARPAVMAMLALVAAGIALYAAVGLYPDKGTTVHTAAGDYVANSSSAEAQQQAIDFVRSHTAPGEPILALPADAGSYFLADRPQALYENMFLPGLLDTKADERIAIARLRAEGVRYALVSNRDTSAFETGRFGSGYDQLLGRYLRSGRLVASFGDLSAAPGGGNPSEGFRDLRATVSDVQLVGVHPGSELRRRPRLFAALSEAFPGVRFEAREAGATVRPRRPDRARRRGARPGTPPQPACGRSRPSPPRASRAAAAIVDLGAATDLDRRLHGQALPDRHLQGAARLAPEQGAEVLASVAGAPVWVRAGRLDLVATAPAELADDGAAARPDWAKGAPLPCCPCWSCCAS